MRDQKTWSMRLVWLLSAALAVGMLFALGSAAAIARPAPIGPASGPDGKPLRFYTLSRIDATTGKVTVADGAQQGGRLHKVVKIGRAAFVIPHGGKIAANDEVFSSANGSQYNVFTQAPSPVSTDPGTPRGGVSHLDEFQAYRKRSGDASLSVTISQAIIRTLDDETRPSGCPPPDPGGDCPQLRGIVRFHARAYAASAGGDFFSVGGTAVLEGHRHGWFERVATDADLGAPAWD